MPEYNESKNYQWNPEADIVIKGQEFADFFHLLNEEINTPSGASIALKMNAFSTMRSIFSRCVKDSIFTEVKASEQDSVNNLFSK
jgi:hypothetical protein